MEQITIKVYSFVCNVKDNELLGYIYLICVLLCSGVLATAVYMYVCFMFIFGLPNNSEQLNNCNRLHDPITWLGHCWQFWLAVDVSWNL